MVARDRRRSSALAGIAREDGGVTIPFVDPADRRTKLTRAGNEWTSPTGHRFPIVDGVANFVAAADAGQVQTSDSFGYKWNRQPDWGFDDSHQQVMAGVWKDVFGWSSTRDALRDLMAGKIVLDAGCGSGASLNQFVDLPS